VNFDSYQLPGCNLSARIKHLYPSQIELLPAEEGVSCGLENLLSVPEAGSRTVMGKSGGRLRA
jgi:hypothetical protein